MSENSVVNIVIAGLGGQGVVKASEILSDAAFRAGHDVKKSEVHGMSQRGGSVTSDVRFGPEVFSPMVPSAGADFLVVLEGSEIEVTRARMKPDGKLFAATEMYDEDALEDMKRERTLNVTMLGAMSAHLDIDDAVWIEAIRANLPARAHETNIAKFQEAKAAEQSQGQ